MPRRSIQKNCIPGAPPIDWAREVAPSLHTVTLGPGDYLAKLIARLGFKRTSGCYSCDGMIGKMNAWGVDGCRENRTAIVEHLRTAYHSTTWLERIASAATRLTTGLAFEVNPLDPFGSLLDLAIVRRPTARP